MLMGKIIAFSCKEHSEHVDAECGKNEPYGTYTIRYTLKD